jgi:hypothetical protein
MERHTLSVTTGGTSAESSILLSPNGCIENKSENFPKHCLTKKQNTVEYTSRSLNSGGGGIADSMDEALWLGVSYGTQRNIFWNIDE